MAFENPYKVEYSEKDALVFLKRLQDGNVSEEECAAVRYLDLSCNQLTSIAGIEKLTALTRLGLSYIQLTSIKDIEKLTTLTVLHLTDNQLTSIAGIEKLTALRELYLSNNQLTSIAGIEKLTALRELYLSNNQLTSIKGIENLTALTRLDLSHNQLTSIKGIENLTALTRLDLSYNQLTSIAGIEKLKALKTLYLSNNPFTELPESLADLKNLEYLRLKGLKIKELPESLVTFWMDSGFSFHERHPSSIDRDKIIFLFGTQLSLQPISLFFESKEVIKEYLNAKKIPIQTAKVIFLGNAGAGKTYTIQRILRQNRPLRQDTAPTEGISIQCYRYMQDDQKVQIRFWDFGGQDILYSMHRCFLTQRSLYVVVVENRGRQSPTAQAEEWLENIRHFAPESPVLLIFNQFVDFTKETLNMPYLTQKYPQLINEAYTYHAKASKHPTEQEKADFDSVANAILNHAAEQDSMKMLFHSKWHQVLKALEREAAQKKCIENSEYIRLCEKQKIESPEVQKWLLEWFNDMGIAFSYHADKQSGEMLKDYQVLNPNWVVNAIYKIIISGTAIGGKLNRQGILNAILKGENLQNKGINAPEIEMAIKSERDYLDKHIDYILQIMEKFRLAYRVSEQDGGTWLFPVLCEENKLEKDLVPVGYRETLSYTYDYSKEYLPDNVMYELIIQAYSNGMIGGDRYYRYGFSTITEAEQYGFTVILNKAEKQINITLYQKGSRVYQPTIYWLNNKIKKISNDFMLHPTVWIQFVEGNKKTVSVRVESVQRGLDQYATLDGDVITKKSDEVLRQFYGQEPVALAHAVGIEMPNSAVEMAEREMTYADMENPSAQIGFETALDQIAGLLEKMVAQNNTMIAQNSTIIAQGDEANRKTDAVYSLLVQVTKFEDRFDEILEQMWKSDQLDVRSLAQEVQAQDKPKGMKRIVDALLTGTTLAANMITIMTGLNIPIEPTLDCVRLIYNNQILIHV